MTKFAVIMRPSNQYEAQYLPTLRWICQTRGHRRPGESERAHHRRLLARLIAHGRIGASTILQADDLGQPE